MPKLREAMRDDTREEPRTEMRAPEGERVRLRRGAAVIDPFHIPRELIPPDVSVEWKAYEVVGQQNYSYQRMLADQGWLPADKSMFPGMFGPVGETGSIIVNGQMLHERPLHLTKDAKAEDLARARNVVKRNERSIKDTPDGTAPRVEASIRTTREPIAVPHD